MARVSAQSPKELFGTVAKFSPSSRGWRRATRRESKKLSTTPLLALGWEWLKRLGEDQTATETSHMITQGLAIAQPLKRHSRVERLPIASAIGIVQGLGRGWRDQEGKKEGEEQCG